MELTGLPGDYLRELYFKNVTIKAKTGLISSDVHDITFDNVKINPLPK
jgi:hypothetical protein